MTGNSFWSLHSKIALSKVWISTLNFTKFLNWQVLSSFYCVRVCKTLEHQTPVWSNLSIREKTKYDRVLIVRRPNISDAHAADSKLLNEAVNLIQPGSGLDRWMSFLALCLLVEKALSSCRHKMNFLLKSFRRNLRRFRIIESSLWEYVPLPDSQGESQIVSFNSTVTYYLHKQKSGK